MTRRRIANTPFETGKLALGCVTFGREIAESAAWPIMDHALANGLTLFDTADAYGGGASERAIERSLERLQSDRVDLYLLHRLSAKTPLQETLDALGGAMRRGLVGAIGCSNCTAAQLFGNWKHWAQA